MFDTRHIKCNLGPIINFIFFKKLYYLRQTKINLFIYVSQNGEHTIKKNKFQVVASSSVIHSSKIVYFFLKPETKNKALIQKYLNTLT